jgi:hypothetical protein
MAAMVVPMTATAASSSVSVNPWCERMFTWANGARGMPHDTVAQVPVGLPFMTRNRLTEADSACDSGIAVPKS